MQEEEYQNVVSAIRAVRFLSSKEKQDSDFTPLFRTGFVDKIAGYMQYNEYPELVYECLWVLTNACMGSNGEVEALLGVQNLFELANQLIEAPVDEGQEEEVAQRQCMVKEQAMWLVANIAAHSDEARQRVVNSGFLQSISTFLSSAKKVRRGVLAVFSWAVANCLLGRQKV